MLTLQKTAPREGADLLKRDPPAAPGPGGRPQSVSDDLAVLRSSGILVTAGIHAEPFTLDLPRGRERMSRSSRLFFINNPSEGSFV